MIKRWIRENKGFVIFMLSLLFVRSALANWNHVPSGSMYPNLMIGDMVVSNRVAYDIKLPFTDVILKHVSDPKRGDIVTFTSPSDGKLLVKRLIAVPGDVVEMRDEKLIINGIEATYSRETGPAATRTMPGYEGKQWVLSEQFRNLSHSIIVMPERYAKRSFGPLTVPQGQYLMLGDNRDNSADSRYIGFVKRELLVGRVERIAFSLDAERYYLPRTDRFWAPAQ